MPAEDPVYSFNGEDYEFVVRLFNGIHDVYLNNTIWDDLILEEDIFNWAMKGSITIKSPFETLERASQEALDVTKKKPEELIYKFRNDGRDTIFITAKPKFDTAKGPVDRPDKEWRLEIEAVIFEVEDLPNPSSITKNKKLYFWDKTFQMMTEKDSAFSTSNTGPNRGKPNISQASNSDRSLAVGTTVAALLQEDFDFGKHSKLTEDPEHWDHGGEDTKLFYSSPVGAKFIDDLSYLMQYTLSSDTTHNQPCILKLERAEKTKTPKQFSLKSIQKYFENAGKDITAPKPYQIDHFFIMEHSADEGITVPLQKAPLDPRPSDDPGVTEFKADEYSNIRGYQLVDISGKDYSRNFTNYRVTCFNSTAGQFGEEAAFHGAEEYKKFFDTSIMPNIVTQNKTDRLVFTPFIKDKLNTRTIYSLRNDEVSRLADGRNRLLKYYLFANLAISFSVQGSTHRQTGRFFGLSKRTNNHEEHDHKLEGQYFVTSIIHHFSNANRDYTNHMVGVKTHTYEEKTEFVPNDVIITK